MKIQDAIKVAAKNLNIEPEILKERILKIRWDVDGADFKIKLCGNKKANQSFEMIQIDVSKYGGLEIREFFLLDDCWDIALDCFALYEQEDGSWYGELDDYEDGERVFHHIEDFRMEELECQTT